MKYKDKLVYLLTIILSAAYIFFGNKAANANKIDYSLDYGTGTPYKAEVTNVLDENYQKTLYPDFDAPDQVILFEAQLISGYREGETVKAIQTIDSMYAIDQKIVQSGDKIVVYANQNEDARDVQFMFAEYHRIDFIIFLAVRFCVLLLVFGHKNGVNTLVSLVFTVGSVFYVFIPAVLNGGNIYSWAISTCIYIIFMTLLIISGYSRKSLAAMIGCSSGVIAAGIITVITDHFVHLTGLTDEDSMYLLFLNSENPIDLKAIIFAAIILGAVGAIMDVSMSLSSSLAELKEKVGDMTAMQITRSGMVVGRDIMGTMANTLILAFAGASLNMLILFQVYGYPLIQILNSDGMAVELIQSVAGSVGILLTVPLVALFCARLMPPRRS